MKIVVTGGSRGIGKKIVEHLQKNNEIYVISRTTMSTKKIKKELSSVTFYTADVSDYKKIKNVFEKIGDFDALINCAGVLGPVGSIENNSLEEWEDTIKVNLLGTVYCCRAAIPVLRKRKYGRIINISGGGSAFPRPFHSAYACSKTAVVRFTENLAKELILDGVEIDVNVIAPGAHKTDLWKKETFDKEPDKWDDPKKLIKLVNFLLSEKSKGISGKFLSIKDDYEKFDKSITYSDIFTLRRVDNFKFKKID